MEKVHLSPSREYDMGVAFRLWVGSKWQYCVAITSNANQSWSSMNLFDVITNWTYVFQSPPKDLVSLQGCNVEMQMVLCL